MIAYIKEIAEAILSSPDAPNPGREQVRLFDLAKALSEELDRLDPRDFRPDSRFAFVRCRTEARWWTRLPPDTQTTELKAMATEVAALIDNYGVYRKGSPIRVFRWLSSQALKDIIERDYAELSHVLLPDGAWKSTVIMAGSILEAILVDLVIMDSARLVKAKASPKAPKTRTGSLKSEDEWTLNDLIGIAADIALLTPARAATFDQVLRDYRNFVHPRKEVRAAHPCSDGEAFMAKGALDALCDHFDRTL